MKMVVSQQDGKEVNNEKASLEGGETVQRKSLFGRYSDSEMLSQLKGLALNPCDSRVSQDSIWPLWNQTLRLRKVMALSDTEFPRRKRKLQQFLKDKFKVAPVFASELSNQQNVTKLSRGQLSHVSSVSCLLNSVDSVESYNQKTLLNSLSSGSLLTFEDDFQQKQEISEFSFLDNGTEFGSLNKDTSFLLDSDESANGSNPMSPQNLTLQEPLSLDLSDSIHSSNSLNVEEPKEMHLEKPRRSIRLLNFIGDCLQRIAIPIGPRFQADVPEWTGQANKENFNGKDGDSESSRWLGTRVWPIGGRNMEIARAVGKGRPDSCSCVSPGSTDCIKHHIFEERLLLQSDLGPAFLSWKFDEMGEVVSKSWTLSEQQKFESLVKIYPLSLGKNLLKHALKSFPSKCKRSILSYYLNVFVPRRLSRQTRSSVKQVDSDDDLAAGVNYIDLPERCKGRIAIIGSSKNVRSQYLCLHP